MQIMTLSKKFLSIILSVVLVLSLTPGLSYADDGEGQQNVQVQAKNDIVNETGQQETPATESTESNNNSDEVNNIGQSQSGDNSDDSQSVQELDDTKAFEFIYIDQKEIELNATQSVVVSFIEKENASTSVLYYQKTDGSMQTVEPAQVEDGAALFELTFTSSDQIGTYKLVKVTWSGNNPGEANISIDDDSGYSFAVIANSSENDPTTVFTIDEDGQLTEEESLTEAIEESDNGKNQGLVASPLARSASANSRAGEMVIALDPGHGGYDGGASYGGLVEKTLNLKIATYCKEALEKYSNVRVYMTRSTDEYVGLTERVTRAVNAGADVFVSFHINATAGASGFEVWIQNDSTWRYYLHEESSSLGSSILDKLEKFGLKNRGNKERDYTGLYYPDGSRADSLAVLRESRNNNIPAVLIEHGFIDGSAADRALLSDENSLKAMGEADAEGIAEYYGLNELKPRPWMSDSANGSITIEWEPVEGATKYAVALFNDDGSYENYTTECTDTSYVVNGLQNGKEYKFLVQAWVNGKWNSWSDRDFLTCQLYPSPEPYVSSTGDGSVTLTWDAIDGAEKYAVAEVVNGKYINATTTLTDTTYTVDNLANGYEHTFLVQSYINGKWSNFSEVNYVKATPQGTTKPTLKAKASGISGQVAFSWNKVPGATKYALGYQKSDGSFYNYSTSLTDTSYIVNDLQDGKEYKFLVQAWINGKWSEWSEADLVKVTSTNDAAPKPYVSSTGDGSVTLTWGAIDGAEKYAVAEVVNGKYINATTTLTDTTYTVDNLANGYEHTFLVQSYINGKWSNFSEVNYVKATPQGTTKPANISVEIGSGSVTFNWNKVPGATKYAVALVNDGKFINYTTNLTIPNYTVRGLSNGQTYTFLIQSYSGGSWSLFDSSDYISVTLPGYMIMGSSNISVDQLINAFNSSGFQYPSNTYSSKGAPTIQDFCQIVIDQARAENVKPEVLFAQAMLETGWLQFGGSVKAEQCNFGGLGATGNGNPGNSFETVEIGLRAQAQHLKAYASTEPVNGPCYDIRFGYVARGSAPTVQDLGNGKWASDPLYGVKIMSIINSLSD